MLCLLLKKRDKSEWRYPNFGRSLLRRERHYGTGGVEGVIVRVNARSEPVNPTFVPLV